MWTSHWHWPKSSCNSHSVSLFVCLFQFSFIFHLTKISFWFFDLNTETKDWHQKFLQIVLRNLLNWCKCVGRNDLNNVLYSLFVLFRLSFDLCLSWLKCWWDFELICTYLEWSAKRFWVILSLYVCLSHNGNSCFLPYGIFNVSPIGSQCVASNQKFPIYFEIEFIEIV
jgi:hypothetical protein